MKYSIIVPAYNCEETIKECLDSILSQNYDDYEIIVVNDGSTDKTAMMLQQYADLPRLRLINQCNQGAYCARNTGIDNAEGDWILFVDSDDVVSGELLCTIEKNMTDDVDMLGFSLGSITQKNSNKTQKVEETRTYNREEFLENIVRKTIVNGIETVSMCNKVYRKELIKKYTRAYNHSFLEDYLFNMWYYRGVNKYTYINQELYFVRFRPNSLSHTFNSKAFELLNEVDKTKKEVLKEMNLITNEDMIQASAWYIQYITNFMKRFIFSKGLGINEVKKILADERLISKCRNVSHTKLSTNLSEYIAMGSTFKALFCIIKDNLICRTKVTVKYTIINKVEQIRGTAK